VWCLSVSQEGQSVSGVDNVLVTAASRGIIQRQHQRAALFYKNYSLGNPFDNVTKDDLDAYRREVERKEKRRAGKSDNLCHLSDLPDVVFGCRGFHSTRPSALNNRLPVTLPILLTDCN